MELENTEFFAEIEFLDGFQLYAYDLKSPYLKSRVLNIGLQTKRLLLTNEKSSIFLGINLRSFAIWIR